MILLRNQVNVNPVWSKSIRLFTSIARDGVAEPAPRQNAAFTAHHHDI
jgi:hypothetical protein